METGNRSARFAVQAKSRAPYPNELERLQQSRHGLAASGHPLIVAPFISEPLGSILTRDGWSWADTQGNFDLRAPGLLLRQRRTPVEVAVRAGRVSTPGRPIVVSADVGPDLILPWRRPSLVILYAKHAIASRENYPLSPSR